jgi:ATP-dependent exoDNAse (exonuclease V) beta subunit
MHDIVDQDARDQALDVGRSFIVQAPAGSGKTELLIQRYLALLATVDAPEEILAITFTRKAAAEMRMRILSALRIAGGTDVPKTAHEAQTRQLARDVLDRDTRLEWRLLESPTRLRVMTIDALHALLNRQLPILSGIGGSLKISDQPETLYLDAARRTLAGAGESDETGSAIRGLLAHLDNRFDRVEAMLVDLLARRDQWLPRVTTPGAMSIAARRRWLESSLCNQIESTLRLARSACPDELVRRLPPLAAYAADQLGETGTDSAVNACRELSDWPPTDATAVGLWKGLADMLLVKGGKAWRKTVTKNNGFPTSDRGRKDEMRELLAYLSDYEPLIPVMEEIRELPAPGYDERQWQILEQLLTVLPRCAAELEVVIRQSGSGDYVAVSTGARRALDSGEGPTDLALALDYRLRHLLVDEFQDTSIGQVELLRLLTAGWEETDGRTLFCVGDPMQSIYGFREAEVGLFLELRRIRRINEVPLEALTLHSNFRSDQGVVTWVNETLAGVMPDFEDARLGGVPFVSATAVRAPGPDDAVCFHAFLDDDGSAEARTMSDVVRRIRSDEPEASIAILVRAKSHLQRIAPTLKADGQSVQAVDIENLADRPVIQDLMSLTRALCHFADRTAWLAILRAPWCGMRLADLADIAGDRALSIWERMQDPEVLDSVDRTQRERLARFSRIVDGVLQERGRRPLHRLVKSAWLALGGPATVDSPAALVDAESFFVRLSELEQGADLEEPARLEEQLANLFATPDPEADDSLQLMTIHKAKGLQFDYVLIPGLDRSTGRGGSQLLHWLEAPRADGPADLILAPIEERGADRDPLHVYLRRQEAKKSAYELGRLLYVAVTRARRQIHLFGSVRTSAQANGDHEFRPPGKGTLLGLLWSSCEKQFLASLDSQPAEAGVAPAIDPAVNHQTIQRLSLDWRLPSLPDGMVALPSAPRSDDRSSEVEYWWAGRASRAVGRVVHHWLDRISSDGVDRWTPDRVRGNRPRVERMLAEEGLEPELSVAATEDVVKAVMRALEDDNGRWILSAGHREIHNEYSVAGLEDGVPVHVVIDRTFVDEDGLRWVVDYKTGEHEGAELDAFLDREVERYRGQMERYGRLMSALHPHDTVRLALYFPMHGRIRSWDWEATA